LNGDNELIAFRAAGVGFMEFLPGVLYVLLATTTLAYINSIAFIPAANQAFKSKLSTLGRATLPALLREGVFIDTIPGLVFFFQRVRPSDLTIEGIFVQDSREPEVQMSIVAERAQISCQQDLSNLTFRISSGVITRTGEDLKEAQVIGFKDYELNLPLAEMLDASPDISKGKREMSLGELYERTRQKTSHSPYPYALEFHQRLALPLSCLLLGLVGAPLGAVFRQRQRMTGVTLGLSIFLIYYLILSAGKGIGENGIVPPSLSIWTANALTLVTACYLWVKVHRETPFKAASLWKDGMTRWKTSSRSHSECQGSGK
jgi:lipopolysaccharide export system permease protein